MTKRRYANADYRIFTFADPINGTYELVESEETEQRGGGMGRRFEPHPPNRLLYHADICVLAIKVSLRSKGKYKLVAKG